MDERDNRPIVERPDWLWEKRADGSWEYWTRESKIVREHIERLEKEKDRLEAAIRQKDNALEVCQDRRWEAEEKVGELMREVDRLNNVR